MEKNEKKKTALNDWGTLIADFNALPKIVKKFFILCAVFLFFFAIFATPDMPSEADRMRNRIAELQKDMREKANLVGYEQYSSGQSARQAKGAIVNALSNPMGPSEEDRKNYREGVDEIRYKDEISNELIAQIAADQAEIKRIQDNLAAGVYKEK